MINLNVRPEEIGVAISPNGNPMVTGLDRTANILVSIEINSLFWKQFVEKCGELSVSGVVPATLEDIAKVRNGGS